MSSNAKTKRELDAVIRLALEHGWRVERTAIGHYKFIPPVKTVPAVVTGGTPSCARAMRNLLATLRRSGLPIPHRAA